MGRLVNVTPRPLYPQERNPIPIAYEVWWAPRPVYMGAENLDLSGIFFIFLCSVFYLYLFLCLDCPAFCLLSLLTTQTSMSPAGFEPAIPAGERPQTYALDRVATGIGSFEPATPASDWL